MADGHGGYRRPQKPAAVSGPGKYSKRTDGGVSQPAREMVGGDYGDATEMRNLQSAAPMAASGRTQGGDTPQPMQQQGPMAVPFGAPTQRPNEPVTAGNPMGPGPGASATPSPYSSARLSESLRQVLAADVDGSLDSIIMSLESNGL